MAQRNLFGNSGGNTRTRRSSTISERRKKDSLRVKGDSNTLEGKIELARETVEKLLGYLKNDLLCITEEEELIKYIDQCIKDVEVGLDTETMSLDWIEGEIAGLCLYSESQRGCYIPINHISFMTGRPIKNQLPREVVARELKRMVDGGCKFITHNGVFDKHVCYWYLGVDFPIYWDTLTAGWLLNENEPHGLKYLWDKYCKPVREEEEEPQPIATFNTLFDKISFVNVPLDIAYIYAAEDPVKTFQLYKFQKKIMERPNMSKVYTLFRGVEIPMLQVVNDMENTGVVLDTEYANVLAEKYGKQLADKKAELLAEVANIQGKLDAYKRSHPNTKLENPINFSSPVQLAELFYDVLKLSSGDKKNPRGTGKDQLNHLAEEGNTIATLLLDYRKLDKLMSAFLITLPQQVRKKTGKIHANFNPIGATTGRMSSSSPNLQQIPSHNTEIRRMFTVPDGYCMFGGDFSGQEVRLMADMCGDENMINSYLEGKDLYSTIASLAFDKSYEECCEFAPDGSKNPHECKERRSQAKSIVLGINYGRGIASIAEQIHKSEQEAQEIQDKVFKSFQGIPKFIEDSQQFARDNGYVEDRWGRKRRIPIMQEPKYDVVVDDITKLPNYDPLTEEDNIDDLLTVDDETWYYFIDKLNSCKWWSQKKNIYEEAKRMGYMIIDNGKDIADAERQCVNSRIQGSAATMAKIALVSINTNEEFKKLGGQIILVVHDEIICQCPIENIKRCSEILEDLMSHCIPDCKIPFPVDVEKNIRWYGKSYEADELVELYKTGKLDTKEGLY